MPLKVDKWVLYRNLKIKVYNVGVRGREFTETKTSSGWSAVGGQVGTGERWNFAESSWGEVPPLREEDHSGGRGLRQSGQGVELALCESC